VWWLLLTEDGDVGGGVVFANVIDRAAEILAGIRRQQFVKRQLQPACGQGLHPHVTVLLTHHRKLRL